MNEEEKKRYFTETTMVCFLVVCVEFLILPYLSVAIRESFRYGMFSKLKGGKRL